MMRLVILETPFSSNDLAQAAIFAAYAKQCLLDCLIRDESPLAGHLLYTQVLDDKISDQRRLGIGAHLAWVRHADAMVVYIDHGVSAGMLLGIKRARAFNIAIEQRKLRGMG